MPNLRLQQLRDQWDRFASTHVCIVTRMLMQAPGYACYDTEARMPVYVQLDGHTRDTQV